MNHTDPTKLKIPPAPSSTHYYLCWMLESKGYIVREDSEDDSHSYIYQDKDSDTILGHVRGDCEARIEWEPQECGQYHSGSHELVSDTQRGTRYWQCQGCLAYYTDEQVASKHAERMRA